MSPLSRDLARFARDLSSEPLPGVRAQQFGQYVAHRLAEPMALTADEVSVLTACLLWVSAGGTEPALLAPEPKRLTILDAAVEHALRVSARSHGLSERVQP